MTKIEKLTIAAGLEMLSSSRSSTSSLLHRSPGVIPVYLSSRTEEVSNSYLNIVLSLLTQFCSFSGLFAQDFKTKAAKAIWDFEGGEALKLDF